MLIHRQDFSATGRKTMLVCLYHQFSSSWNKPGTQPQTGVESPLCVGAHGPSEALEEKQ